MSQFFKALLPLKPTKSGLNFIKTETFMQLCQRVAHTMLTSGKGWDDVDAALRHITVKELLPKRDYDENEVAVLLPQLATHRQRVVVRRSIAERGDSEDGRRPCEVSA